MAEFLERHFADRRYSELRRTIAGMVEGYDVADPRRASTFSLRDEWMGRGLGQQGRFVEGYGALIEYLVSECRRHGASIHLGAAVTAIGAGRRRIAARRHDGAHPRGRWRDPYRAASPPARNNGIKINLGRRFLKLERPLRWRRARRKIGPANR